MATYDLTANAKTTYTAVNTNDISILNKMQITELQKQLSSAESRIKQLLIKYEHSVHDNINKEEE